MTQNRLKTLELQIKGKHANQGRRGQGRRKKGGRAEERQAYQDAVGVVERRFGCDRDHVVPNHSKLVLVLARLCFDGVSPQAAVQMVDVIRGGLETRNKSDMDGQRHTNRGGRTP